MFLWCFWFSVEHEFYGMDGIDRVRWVAWGGT